jgi:hypothetical protein
MSTPQAAEESVKYLAFLAEIVGRYETIDQIGTYSDGTRVICRRGGVARAFLISDLTAPQKIRVMNIAGAAWNNLDQNVDGTAPVTVASTTFQSLTQFYLMPTAAIIQARLGTAPANDLLNVWWDVDGTTRSAKLPMTVRDATKMSFTIPLVASALQFSFWRALKNANQVYTININAQRVTNDANTVIVSDTGFSFITPEF